MLGQLQDAGNATTLAHYLDLLAGAGLVTGLQKYAGGAARRRASSPKLQVFNTALITAQAGLTLKQARENRAFWGRLVESAVGAHLANAAATGDCEAYYWRERNREVDFVVRAGTSLVAIEVKSGRAADALAGHGCLFRWRSRPPVSCSSAATASTSRRFCRDLSRTGCNHDHARCVAATHALDAAPHPLPVLGRAAGPGGEPR